MIEVRVVLAAPVAAGLTLVATAYIVAMALIAASQSRLMDASKRMGERSRRLEGSPRIRQPTGADQCRRDSESDQQNN